MTILGEKVRESERERVTETEIECVRGIDRVILGERQREERRRERERYRDRKRERERGETERERKIQR